MTEQRAPLRIQVLSDLHVDVAPAQLRLALGADVVVVAGDTCEGVEKGFAWLRAAVPAPTPIITVAGNHEHYRHVLPEEIDRGRAGAAEHGITFLENDKTVIGGVRFLGCTLWTDFALRGEAWQAPDMAAAQDGMNDYRRITLSKKPWRRFLPRDALAMHVKSRAWLVQALATPFDGPTVVVIAKALRNVPREAIHDPPELFVWLNRQAKALERARDMSVPAAPPTGRPAVPTPATRSLSARERAETVFSGATCPTTGTAQVPPPPTPAEVVFRSRAATALRPRIVHDRKGRGVRVEVRRAREGGQLEMSL